MAKRSALSPAPVRRVLLALCATSLILSSASAIGVNFGQVANDLPDANTVLQLIKTTSITRVKLYGADPATLTAFAGTGIDFVIGAGNEQIALLADNSTSYALQWVQSNIAAYPNTSIVAVTLGNEVLSYEQNLMPLLVPALQNMHAALVTLGLDQRVKLSTPHSLGIVAKSFPPSFGEFNYVHGQILGPLLDFLTQTGAPFMVNVYPYFAYAANPGNISLDYVLFNPTAPVNDPGSGLDYMNMFDAQVDAVYAAISKLGYNNVSIAVTETGWPSAGDPTENAATVANAQVYNYNLIKHVNSGVGTPARPNVYVETYIFALYNEDMKPGPLSERNFGLYLANGSPIYDSGLTGTTPGWTSPPPGIATPPAVGVLFPPPFSSPPPPSFFSPPPPAVSPGVVSAPPPSPPNSASPTWPSPGYPPAAPGPTGSVSWCVAKPDADVGQLQIALDWACSDGGADCSLIQPGATCFLPNTVNAHASYAFNNYYQLNNKNDWDCFFSDTGLITNVNPSYEGCSFP